MLLLVYSIYEFINDWKHAHIFVCLCVVCLVKQKQKEMETQHIG